MRVPLSGKRTGDKDHKIRGFLHCNHPYYFSIVAVVASYCAKLSKVVVRPEEVLKADQKNRK